MVSDTHGYYDAALDDLLAGAVRIVHAGDIGTLDVLARLRALAPVTAVLGNTDLPFWGDELPWEAEVEALGLRILRRATSARASWAGTTRWPRASTW